MELSILPAPAPGELPQAEAPKENLLVEVAQGTANYADAAGIDIFSDKLKEKLEVIAPWCVTAEFADRAAWIAAVANYQFAIQKFDEHSAELDRLWLNLKQCKAQAVQPYPAVLIEREKQLNIVTHRRALDSLVLKELLTAIRRSQYATDDMKAPPAEATPKGRGPAVVPVAPAPAPAPTPTAQRTVAAAAVNEPATPKRQGKVFTFEIPPAAG